MEYKNAATYWIAALFVIGNIALPHLSPPAPSGGPMLLPIYSFTLVAAYKYGWNVGLLTAVASPLVNSALFAMPAPALLPAILTKSLLLAAAAGFAARKFRRVSLLLLLGVVLFYQVIGSAAEWGLTGSLAAALQDFRIGIPGMLLQILGGYFFIKHLK